MKKDEREVEEEVYSMNKRSQAEEKKKSCLRSRKKKRRGESNERRERGRKPVVGRPGPAHLQTVVQAPPTCRAYRCRCFSGRPPQRGRPTAEQVLRSTTRRRQRDLVKLSSSWSLLHPPPPSSSSIILILVSWKLKL